MCGMFITQIENTGLTKKAKGLHWDGDNETLYYVDAVEGTVHSYIPATGEYGSGLTDYGTPFLIPIAEEKSKFLISSGRRLLAVEWNGKTTKARSSSVVVNLEKNQHHRIKGGVCDPSGRLWFGAKKVTLGEPSKGDLFTVESNGSIQHRVDNVCISNGLAWKPNGDKMYCTDRANVQEFDFDLGTGNASNGHIVCSLANLNIDAGSVDDIAVDTDGNLWLAIYDEYKVIGVDLRRPDSPVHSLMLPAKQPTSLAFGGANLDELYVATGNWGWDGDVLDNPVHGSLFKLSGLGVKGIKSSAAKMDVKSSSIFSCFGRCT